MEVDRLFDQLPPYSSDRLARIWCAHENSGARNSVDDPDDSPFLVQAAYAGRAGCQSRAGVPS